MVAGLGSSRPGSHGRPRCLRRSLVVAGTGEETSNGKSKLRAWRLSAGPDGGGRPMSIKLCLCACVWLQQPAMSVGGHVAAFRLAARGRSAASTLMPTRLV